MRIVDAFGNSLYPVCGQTMSFFVANHHGCAQTFDMLAIVTGDFRVAAITTVTVGCQPTNSQTLLIVLLLLG